MLDREGSVSCPLKVVSELTPRAMVLLAMTALTDGACLLCFGVLHANVRLCVMHFALFWPCHLQISPSFAGVYTLVYGE